MARRRRIPDRAREEGGITRDATAATAEIAPTGRIAAANGSIETAGDTGDIAGAAGAVEVVQPAEEGGEVLRVAQPR